MKVLCVFMILSLSTIPVFADTSVICKANQGYNSTIINCPNPPPVIQTQTAQPTTQPYYTNPNPSNSIVKDFVNTIFSKIGQSAMQMSGGTYGPNAGAIQNVTNGFQGVIDTGIDYVSSIKYLVAGLLGIIVPRLFGIDVPWWLLPAIEWGSIAVIAYAVWKKAWEIFVISLIIGIAVLILFYVGGVLFH